MTDLLMPVELFTMTSLKADRYLWWLEAMEVDQTRVNTGTSLCLDPNGKSAVSHDIFFILKLCVFDNVT